MKKYYALVALMLCWLMCAVCCFEHRSYVVLLGMSFSWLCIVLEFFSRGFCDELLGAILVAFLFWYFLKVAYRNVGNCIVCAACLILHLSGAWYIILWRTAHNGNNLCWCVLGACVLLSVVEILVCICLGRSETSVVTR